MNETHRDPVQLLNTCIVPADDVKRVIADRRITLETLVSVGVNDKGETELRWVEYPAKLKDKVAIPLKPTKGFAYFASIQAVTGWQFILAEGEHTAVRHANAPRTAKAITEALPASAKNRTKPTVFDLHLVTPENRERIETVKMADNRADALFAGQDADELHFPRLSPLGIFAARGSQVLVFPWKQKAYETETAQAPVIAAFRDQIVYLSRVHQNRKVMVATTQTGRTFALDLARITDKDGQAKVVGEAETNARFVGTPGGNGLEICLEIGRQGDDQALIMWPKATQHAAAIIQAAC